VCSCVILALAIINFHLGPVINGKIVNYSLENCKKKSDDLEDYKNNPLRTEDEIKRREREINECRNRKAMSIMEYLVFIIDLGIGFICVILGLNGIQKELMPKTGLLAMILGVIGFILSFIYLVLNGIVYTNYNDGNNKYKIDGDGAFAELKGDKYECFYFSERNNQDALYAKFSDLIKSQYNYNKELNKIKNDEFSELHYCNRVVEPSHCLENGYIEGKVPDGRGSYCSKLYYYSSTNSYAYYSRSSRFLACLLITLFISLCFCGLAFCGFMLNKEP